MQEFRLDKAKDIVGISDVDKHFRILDSDNNLIIEGKGGDIFEFLRHAEILIECKIKDISYNVNDGRVLGDCPVLLPHWEEAGILCYQIRLPFEFSKVEGYTVYVKRESLENQLKDKITPVDILPNQTFNVRKTAALTSLLVFLCIGSFLTGNILLHYTSVNIILAWVLISICIITLPFMLYYVWKLDRWMNEK